MARIIDYHIHTSFSDGFFDPQEMILAAVERGIKEICITDHYSTWKPALSDWNLDEYHSTLQGIRKEESSDVQLFIGIEVDTSSIVSFKLLQELEWDLILFEYIFSQPQWEKAFHQMIRFKKEFPDFQVGLAHTRFTRVQDSKLDYVLEKILEYNIIIELNTNYRNYLDKYFSYLDEEFYYSIGSDAHNKESLGNYESAISFLREKNIPFSQIVSL
ncbi:MAG: PHP domain-containing protein [Candidatus Hodarchaeales archaeon]